MSPLPRPVVFGPGGRRVTGPVTGRLSMPVRPTSLAGLSLGTARLMVATIPMGAAYPRPAGTCIRLTGVDAGIGAGYVADGEVDLAIAHADRPAGLRR